VRTVGISDLVASPCPRKGLGAILALLTIGMLSLLTGCGSSTSNTPIASSSEDQLLTSADFSQQPPGSVERTFLEYWSSLQYRSWSSAAAYYDPRFRDSVGTASVIGAKKLNSSVYPLTKPEITRVKDENNDATIFYTLSLPEGTKELDSISWRNHDGNWQIVFDSRLDAELGQFATNKVEVEENGTLPTGATPASPNALRAGKEAERLQADFVQKELSGSAP
jgi:hypothetical protein